VIDYTTLLAERRLTDLRPRADSAGPANALRGGCRTTVRVRGSVDVAARGAHRFIGERRKGNSEVDRVAQTGPDRGIVAYVP
jgi:hypothetical protein